MPCLIENIQDNYFARRSPQRQDLRRTLSASELMENLNLNKVNANMSNEKKEEVSETEREDVKNAVNESFNQDLQGAACDYQARNLQGVACDSQSQDPQGAACDSQTTVNFPEQKQDSQGAACNFQKTNAGQTEPGSGGCETLDNATVIKRPVPVFMLDKISDLSILDEPAVGVITPKRWMMISPDDSLRKPTKSRRREGNLSLNELSIVDTNNQNKEIGKDADEGRDKNGCSSTTLEKKEKKKHSPRLKIAAKFTRGIGSSNKISRGKVQAGQSLILDHFSKTPNKGNNDEDDLKGN